MLTERNGGLQLEELQSDSVDYGGWLGNGETLSVLNMF